MSLIVYKNAERPFLCTQAQADVLDRLIALRKGGIGSVTGYRPTSGYVKSPTINLQFITRFETAKLYERKRKALEAIMFADCAEDIAKHPKLAALPSGECLNLFTACKEAAIASLQKTLDGDRSDSHRQGHDRCYIKVTDGVKVNLVTEKVNGIEQPVLTDGLPTAASIMLAYLEIKRTVITEGERKVVNSGPKVLMDKIIESKMNKTSVSYRTLSLRPDNFDSLVVDRQRFTPEDLKIAPKSQYAALLEAAGFSEDAIRLAESA